MFLVKYYLVFYVIFIVWLDLVIFLYYIDLDIFWYCGDDWYFFKGVLLIIDYDYGFINFIYYNIGIYVVYYIFLSMFYYYLKMVMEVIKFILGKYYCKLS